MGHDVFISHSSRDILAADAVCAALEASGVRCWIAPRDILPGKSWGASIADAIGQSRLMLLLFSAGANESGQVKREIERAGNRGMPIVPVRLEDALPSKELEHLIGRRHWLDASAPPFEQHLHLLVKAVRRLLDSSGPASEGSSPGSVAKPLVAAPGSRGTGLGARFNVRSMACVIGLVLCALIGVGLWMKWSDSTKHVRPHDYSHTQDPVRPATTRNAREQWADMIYSIPTPTLSPELLPAWADAREQFAHAAPGNPTDVQTKLTQLEERLQAFDKALVAENRGVSPGLAASAAAKRKELLQEAVDAVRASPSSAELPGDIGASIEVQFAKWIKANNALESAGTALKQHQYAAALAMLDEYNKSEGDPVLREQADALRNDILDGVVSNAETKGDSGAWRGAIDLLTRFGRLGDGERGASLQQTVVADLLVAAASNADGDATARQEALNLLSQLDRVAKANDNAFKLRRQIEGRGYYDNAVASVKKGAFQKAADDYQKAGERSYPGAAHRLQVARVLAAADTLWKNATAGVEQLESALRSLNSTPAFNADEQAQAIDLSKRIQYDLAAKYFGLAQGQESATPPNFAAAVNYYQKSASYGIPEGSARQQAARQLIDLQKLTGLAAIKKIAEIRAGLNDAEMHFATSVREQITAGLLDAARKNEKESKYDDAILCYANLLAAQKDYPANPAISQRLDTDKLVLARKARDSKKWQEALKKVNEIPSSSALAKDASELRQQITDAAVQAGMEAYAKANYVEARDHFSAAASGGNADAMLHLAWIYRDGVSGVPADRAKAESFSRSAAQTGNADAMRYLADLLSGRGRGVVQWSDEAETWYQKALATQPADVNAMLGLAAMYRQANKIDAARDMYQRAANQKSVPALLALAELTTDPAKARPLYQAVLDLDKNNAEAAAWMRGHHETGTVAAPIRP